MKIKVTKAPASTAKVPEVDPPRAADAAGPSRRRANILLMAISIIGASLGVGRASVAAAPLPADPHGDALHMAQSKTDQRGGGGSMGGSKTSQPRSDQSKTQGGGSGSGQFKTDQPRSDQSKTNQLRPTN